jgi:hypothetical protein
MCILLRERWMVHTFENVACVTVPNRSGRSDSCELSAQPISVVARLATHQSPGWPPLVARPYRASRRRIRVDVDVETLFGPRKVARLALSWLVAVAIALRYSWRQDTFKREWPVSLEVFINTGPGTLTSRRVRVLNWSSSQRIIAALSYPGCSWA